MKSFRIWWVWGCWVQTRHTRHTNKMAADHRVTHNAHHKQVQWWGWRCGGEMQEKEEAIHFLPSHCLVIRHVFLSLCVSFCVCLFEKVFQKWTKMRNWNTHKQKPKGEIGTERSSSFSISFLMKTVAIVDRIGTTRCAFLSPFLLLLLRNSISFLSKNLLLCSLGGFFQNFVVQKCYRCSGWKEFFFIKEREKKKCRGWRKLMWNKERGSSLYVSVCDSGPLYLSRFSPEHPTHTRHNYIIDAMYIYKADVCFVLCFGGGGGM